jgi:hypothetical protein
VKNLGREGGPEGDFAVVLALERALTLASVGLAPKLVQLLTAAVPAETFGVSLSPAWSSLNRGADNDDDGGGDGGGNGGTNSE